MANSLLASSSELDVFDAAALFVEADGAEGVGSAAAAGAGDGAGAGAGASGGVGEAGASFLLVSVSVSAEGAGSFASGVAEVASPAEVSVSSAREATGSSSGAPLSSIVATV